VGGSAAVLLQVLFIGPLMRRIRKRNLRVLVVPQNRKDLIAITELCEQGAVVPVIDREYPLRDTREAMRYVAEGYAKGKVVIVTNGVME
jgi:NADPH:quinone reductase-like Zn-dependent oxidoreductase